jgi:putative transposase
VERNPVRAGMVRRAEDYRWSSAVAHCSNIPDGLLNLESGWSKQFAAIKGWSVWLEEGDATEGMQVLRQNIEKGLPCGNESFVQQLGMLAGRQLEYRPPGRPKKQDR